MLYCVGDWKIYIKGDSLEGLEGKLRKKIVRVDNDGKKVFILTQSWAAK